MSIRHTELAKTPSSASAQSGYSSASGHLQDEAPQPAHIISESLLPSAGGARNPFLFAPPLPIPAPFSVISLAAGHAPLAAQPRSQQPQQPPQEPVRVHPRAVAYSNRSSNVDVCPSCWESLTDTLKALLQLEPTVGNPAASIPCAVCDVCRCHIEIATNGMPTRLSIIMSLKSHFETLGPSSIDGLVASTLSFPPSFDDLHFAQAHLVHAGFDPVLAFRICSSLLRQQSKSQSWAP